MPQKVKPPVDAFEAEGEQLFNRLARQVAQIKREAKGRVCGQCTHFMGSYCAKVISHKGEELQIHTPHAVACRSFSLREQ